MSTKKRPFSPVDEFIKTFNEMSARYSRNELWYNYIDMHAIALAVSGEGEVLMGAKK